MRFRTGKCIVFEVRKKSLFCSHGRPQNKGNFTEDIANRCPRADYVRNVVRPRQEELLRAKQKIKEPNFGIVSFGEDQFKEEDDGEQKSSPE